MADPDDTLAQARDLGVGVTVDPESRTMHLSFPRWMEADMLADIIRMDNPDDPVEAGRQIWNQVAPTLRESGMSDEQIIEAYGIPDEVLTGEAERRAGVRYAEQRLGWIEGEPRKMYRGEMALIARLRAGDLTMPEYAEALTAFFMERHRREPPEDAVPAIPDGDIVITTHDADPHNDWVDVTLDHLPTGRREHGRASRRWFDSFVGSMRRSLAIDLHLLSRGEVPFHDDCYTPGREPAQA